MKSEVYELKRRLREILTGGTVPLATVNDFIDKLLGLIYSSHPSIDTEVIDVPLMEMPNLELETVEVPVIYKTKEEIKNDYKSEIDPTTEQNKDWEKVKVNFDDLMEQYESIVTYEDRERFYDDNFLPFIKSLLEQSKQYRITMSDQNGKPYIVIDDMNKGGETVFAGRLEHITKNKL